MIRMVFIHPLQRNIEAMKKLANGDFTVRVNHAEHGYVPREMVEFEQSFNKAAEELGGTEILRKDFINNFSHEFKTPIVSISGFADLLLEEQLPPEDQKEFLTIIRDESRRLADLATNILTLNRVESQTILTDKAAFPLDEQLRQSVLVTQQKWRQKELDFDADLAPAEYTGSEGLLKEVWLNLLDNAAKFSPEGGTVAVNLRKAKNALMVSVTDQGEGMRADTQAHHSGQRSGPCHGEKGAGAPRRQYSGEQRPRAGQLLYRDTTHINEKEALKSVSFCFRFKFRRGAPCARRGNPPG